MVSKVDLVLKVLLFPLEILYFHGPKLWGYGFREGETAGTICSEITGVRSEFWSGNDETSAECEVLLTRKFHAFTIGVFTIATTLTFLSICYLSLTRHFLLRPLAASVKMELSEHFPKKRGEQDQ